MYEVKRRIPRRRRGVLSIAPLIAPVNTLVNTSLLLRNHRQVEMDTVSNGTVCLKETLPPVSRAADKAIDVLSEHVSLQKYIQLKRQFSAGRNVRGGDEGGDS